MQYLLDCKSVVNINDIFLGIAIDLSENTIFQLFSYVANMVRISHVMNDFISNIDVNLMHENLHPNLADSYFSDKCLPINYGCFTGIEMDI